MTAAINPRYRRGRPRRRNVVENDDFAAFSLRIIRAHSRRVATGDVEAIRGLVDLATEANRAAYDAVQGLRSHGYSWAEIAARLGVTRQAAQQRWGGERP